MKKTIIKICIILVAITASFGVIAKEYTEKKDTVIIKFGNNSKILLYVSNQDDLETIRKYDINAMLKDLNLSIDSTGDVKYLEIEDSTGKRYIKDTTIVIIENDTIIFDNDDIDDDDEDEPVDRDIKKNHGFKEHKKNIKEKHSFKLDFGMNNYLENGNFPDAENKLYTVKPWGSWYVGLNSIHSFKVTGPVSIETGGGVSWYNFKFQNASTRIIKTESGLEFIDDVAGRKSKITVSYINLQFVPVINFGKASHVEKDGIKTKKYNSNGFRLGIGGYAGYRISSHTKFVHSNNRKKDKDRDNFYLNNWRYGVRLQMGIKDVDFFVNYDLNNLFVENKAPKLNAFSFGVTF